jgi:transcription antitermination factor NusA-like protein
MRYINLLDRVTRIKTTRCFAYNNSIVFAVPKSFVMQAVGKNGSNVHYLQEKIGKKVRIIAETNGKDMERYIQDIIEPGQFKEMKVEGNELIITAGNMQNKANLLGRNKTRLEELREIVKDDFNLELKIL